MLRQIRLEKFPKKVSTFRPQILGSLIAHQRRPYDPIVQKIIASDLSKQNTTYQLYTTRNLNPTIKQNLQFIENTPNILVLEHQPSSLIVQQPIQCTLKEFLSQKETQTGIPYLSEQEAKNLLSDLLLSLQSFQKNNLDYNCINDNNVVRLKGRWMVSLAGVVGCAFAGDKNFFDSKKQGQQGITYALGSLLFKVLFGFVPFQQTSKKPQQFKLSSYIDYLEQEPIKKLQKVYHFADRIQSISANTKFLIEQLLSSRIKSLFELKISKFFTSDQLLFSSANKQFVQKKEIKMLNNFDKKHHSLIMAAIQRKKKHPHEKLHLKMSTDIAGLIQLQQSFTNDSFLRNLKFDNIRTQSQIQRVQQQYNNLQIQCKYFDSEFDFDDKQRPTLDLIKFIDQDKVNNPKSYLTTDREERIKLYAYPYVMVFELANVYREQTVEVKRKIQQLVPYLLEVSAMHWPVERLEKLHNIKPKHMKFEEIKIKYRELINFLYKHFLSEAMKKYNAKKENLTIAEKVKLKQEGLDYYKLCLKLMEASLIVRKGGRDLDLQRIETSQRKEIEQDLELILKTYFPNRVQIK